MAKKILLEKQFNVKKGQPDWKTWARATEHIYKLMMDRRKEHYRIENLKKNICIELRVIEYN